MTRASTGAYVLVQFGYLVAQIRDYPVVTLGTHLEPSNRRSLRSVKAEKFNSVIHCWKKRRFSSIGDPVLFRRPVVVLRMGKTICWNHKLELPSDSIRQKSIYELFTPVVSAKIWLEYDVRMQEQQDGRSTITLCPIVSFKLVKNVSCQ